MSAEPQSCESRIRSQSIPHASPLFDGSLIPGPILPSPYDYRAAVARFPQRQPCATPIASRLRIVPWATLLRKALPLLLPCVAQNLFRHLRLLNLSRDGMAHNFVRLGMCTDYLADLAPSAMQ